MSDADNGSRPFGEGSQGQLFSDAAVGAPAYDDVDSDLVGYRGPTACAAAGITYRQLDYWARTGLVAPSVRSATSTRWCSTSLVRTAIPCSARCRSSPARSGTARGSGSTSPVDDPPAGARRELASGWGAGGPLL